VQWAHDSRRSQAAFTHPRVGVTADIVERENAFLGMADDDFTPAQGDRSHGTQGNFRQRKCFLELWIAHGAHFNRDESPQVLNLSAALDFDFRLEDRDGLADDPDTLDGTVLDFQLHIDPSGAVQLVSLHPAE
jgi:hypothetical protein